MRSIVVLFFLIWSSQSLSQKQISIPVNAANEYFVNSLADNLKKYGLKDLRTASDSLNIRIWEGNGIFNLSHDARSASDYTIYIYGKDGITLNKSFSPGLSKALLDSLLANDVTELKNDDHHGIDGRTYFFEIATRKTYRIYSVWSPDPKRNENNRKIVKILNLIHGSLNTDALYRSFFETLEPGVYPWGMLTFRVDRFLPDVIQKTDFYIRAEKEIKKQFNIDENTSSRNFPSIMINGKPGKIADLNHYTEKEIKTFRIISNSNAAAVYGSNGINGVVFVETR